MDLVAHRRFDQLAGGPNVVGQLGRERWRRLKLGVLHAKIAEREVEANRRFMVLKLLGERIGQSREAPHAHADR
jgi:hypothetical protein